MAFLSPHIAFPNGTCREALSFYQSCLGGELKLMRVGDSAMCDQMPADAQDKIMHGTLTTGQFVLMACDALDPRSPYAPGNNIAMCLNCSSDEEINTLYAALSEGGTVVDPLNDMFWGGKFGTLIDRFGTEWMLNFDKAASVAQLTFERAENL
ncbi:VOC family protein [Microvirga sp. STS02]|uniref:VOC family protein n=1 Tax=Hymenobacter negativus TaxID=2795026 RepID=UPI0018DD8A31|nr:MULTISPECIES: VOC family protein [Bacteria]MBH8568011.1 VOC family protein [Hymenobacter negativus]MBR7207747.1 VOC family protein [Microvirga sp. STS02]